MISEEINGTRNKCTEGSANELCRIGKGSIFSQKLWIYILGERKVVEFFSNENLNKEILDHISYTTPPPPPLEFVKMFTDLILNINKTCKLSCTARKHAQWSMVLQRQFNALAVLC